MRPSASRVSHHQAPWIPCTAALPGRERRSPPVESEIVDTLAEHGWTVAIAESLTGGSVAARLCACPGTEDRVAGGVVTYSTAAKRTVLGVDADRVVSPEAAQEMARSVRELFGTDVGVGVTGVAGPEQQDDQPVGTVFVGWSTPDAVGSERLACAGDPTQVRREAATHTLRLLLEALAPSR